MRKVLTAAALLVIGVAIGAVLFITSGTYDIGADTPHWALTRQIMEVTRERSIAARATSLTIPNLSDEQRILKGAGQYAAMCVNCHSAPGKPDTELGEGLYPKPPNLYQMSLDAKTIFWVTKHGIKMTGMPAWGRTHDDDTIWNVVAFVMKLKGMSGPQYEDIVAKVPPDDDMQDMPNMQSQGGPEKPNKASTGEANKPTSEANKSSSEANKPMGEANKPAGHQH